MGGSFGAGAAHVRILVVFKRLVLGLSPATVTADLEGISASCQGEIIKRFLKTRTFDTWQGQGASQPHRVLDGESDLFLLGNVLDDPTATLSERATSLRLATGKSVHVASICRAMRRLLLTRQRVRASSRRARRRAHAKPLSAWRPPPHARVRRCSTGQRSATRRSGAWGSRQPPRRCIPYRSTVPGTAVLPQLL